MTGQNGVAERLRHLEDSARQAAEDSRDLIDVKSRLSSIEKTVDAIESEVSAIRSAQGRNFIVSLIAATASIGTIAGIVIALSGGGG